MRKRGDCMRALDRLAEEHRPALPHVFASGWDDASWEVRYSQQSNSSSRSPRIHFASLGPDRRPERFWTAHFEQLAKALCCRLVCQRPDIRTDVPLRELLAALRALDAACGPGFSPLDWRGKHFGEAQNRLKAFDEERAGRLAGYLQWIAGVVEAAGISVVALKWKRSTGLGNYMDPERQRRSRGRPLDIETVEAWARLSANPPADAYDRILQRVVDLMVCGGFRLGEVCTLPADTLVREVALDDQGRMCLDERGEAKYHIGLRYWPEKSFGAQTLIKAVPSAMAPVAERAVEELLDLTARARAVARMHAQGLSPLAGTRFDAMPDDAELEGEEINEFLGKRNYSLCRASYYVRFFKIKHRKGIKSSPKGRTLKTVFARLDDLKAAMRAASYLDDCVPRENGFVALQDCLVVLPHGAGPHRTGYDLIVQPIKSADVYNYMRGRKVQRSIFERNDIKLRDGSTVRITPSQIRHWINTLAFRGHLNQAILARWMGRGNIAANARYDGRTTEERIASLKAGMTAAGMLERDDPVVLAPVGREEVAFAAGETGLVTPAGLCTSEYDNAPCPLYESTLGEGLLDQLAASLPADSASAFLTRISTLAATASAAAAAGVPGAARWSTLHGEITERFAWLPDHIAMLKALEKSLYKDEGADLAQSVPFVPAECTYLTAPLVASVPITGPLTPPWNFPGHVDAR